MADALLNGGSFADSLRRHVQRHPDRGYGSMFLEWALDTAAPPYGSWGNGAPMRVAAVGWFAADEGEALQLAEAQSVVSHDHPEAISASQAVALAILHLRRGHSAKEVRARISAQFGYDLRPKAAFAEGGFDVSAIGTTPAAITAALTSSSWEAAVRKAIGLGGDTDTLACIAGAIAEALHGVPPTIASQARAYLTPDLQETLAAFDEAVRGQPT